MLLCFAPAKAQERGFTANFMVNFDTGSLNGLNDLYLIGYKLSPGYSFNEKFSLGAEYSFDIALSEQSEKHDYVVGSALGVAAEYAFYTAKRKQLSARVCGGHSIGSDKWKYYYIDGAVRYRFGQLRYAPVVGIGVKWYGSSTDYFTSPCSAYISLGFRIN